MWHAWPDLELVLPEEWVAHFNKQDFDGAYERLESLRLTNDKTSRVGG